MKTGINYWTLGGFEGEVGVVEAARRAREMGFEGIELCFGAGELMPDTPRDTLSRMREEIERVGIEVPSLATGFYWGKSLSSPDEAERREAVAFTRAYLSAASALGAGAVLVVPGAVAVPWDDSRPVVPAQTVWTLARHSLEELLSVAERERVVIAVENVWNRFLTGPFELASFIDSFDSPWLRSYFDCGNVLLYGHPEHWIEVLGKRIARVHVKNFARRDGAGTLSDFTGSLFEGGMDWAAVFRALRAVGYDGYLTAEMLVSSKGLPDEELAARTSKELGALVANDGQIVKEAVRG